MVDGRANAHGTQVEQVARSIFVVSVIFLHRPLTVAYIFLGKTEGNHPSSGGLLQKISEHARQAHDSVMLQLSSGLMWVSRIMWVSAHSTC